MRFTKKFRCIALLLAAMLLATACQETVKETATPQSTPQATGEEATATVQKAVTATPGEPPGTEIRIGYLQPLTGLAPVNSEGLAGKAIVEGLFDTLVRTDPKGKVIPWLAESWEWSWDHRTLTLYLAKDIKFSDGTDLDAQATLFSMDLFQDPERPKGALVKSLTAWQAIDEFTVQCTLSSPDATALSYLASPAAGIVSPTAYEALDADGFATNPVGSGPYLLGQWVPGFGVVLIKNPDYWREDISPFDRVVWKSFPDIAAAVEALQRGEVDLMHHIRAQDVPTLAAVDGLRVGAYEGGYYALMLNVAAPPFDKLENRQALFYAIDSQAIIDLALDGLARPGGGLIPPAHWAYDPTIPTMARDLGKVAEWLAAAGNPDGFEFKVSVTPHPLNSRILEVMQVSLAEAGITLAVEENELARHMEILRADAAAANAVFVDQSTLRDNPEIYFFTFLGCPGNSYFPFTGYCNQEFDTLVWGATSVFDREIRTMMVQSANRIVAEELPAIPFAVQQDLFAWDANKIKDYWPLFGGGVNYLWIEMDE